MQHLTRDVNGSVQVRVVTDPAAGHAVLERSRPGTHHAEAPAARAAGHAGLPREPVS
ncbi:MAG TPA: hypothetical protein VHF25_10420 [Nitriliruptorales bacterium]|nr:hypothetical protein [Nitriliruptorales bacterium]